MSPVTGTDNPRLNSASSRPANADWDALWSVVRRSYGMVKRFYKPDELPDSSSRTGSTQLHRRDPKARTDP